MNWPAVILSFLLGLGGFFQFNFVGQLSGEDLVAFMLLPLSISNAYNLWRFNKLYRYLLIGVFIWVAHQICTDLIRGIPAPNMAKGAAKILIFGVYLIVFPGYILINKFRTALFLVGLATSTVIQYRFFPTDPGLAEPWKWYFSVSSSALLIAVGVCFFQNVKTYWIFSFLTLGCVSAFQNARSAAGVALLSAILIILNRYLARVSIAIRALLMGCAMAGVIVGYYLAASSGVLGDQAVSKFEGQYDKDKGLISIISGGRSEYRASIAAIKQSPIIGYGSWAVHPEFVYMLLDDRRAALGGEGAIKTYLEVGTIPTHSFLFGAWVDAGILAAFMWALVLFVSAYAIINLRIGNGLAYMALFYGISLCWSIMFSPFSAGDRVDAAYAIACLILISPNWIPKHLRKE